MLSCLLLGLIMRYLPFIAAIACASPMILGRLLTNRFVRRHREDMLASGVIGRIPPLFSISYLVGLLGIVITCVWAFVTVAWWAAVMLYWFRVNDRIGVVG